MSETLQSISFDEIPADYRVPGTYIEAKPTYSNAGLLGYPARALLIGQKLAAGTAAALAVERITRREQLAVLFGAGSVAAQMGEAFLDANTTTDLSVMGMADPGGGVAAAGSAAIAGTSTGAGTLALAIGKRRIAVPLAAGTTAAAAATAMRAAVTAAVGMPVTPSGAAGTVTLTAKHTGVVGNAIPLVLNPAAEDRTPPGLTVTMTAMTGGTGTVDLGDALAVVQAAWYTDIAVAWSDSTNLGELTADLATRYTAMGKRDAHGYAGMANTFGGLSSAGAALNSSFLTVMGANGSRSAPWEWAASLCGVGVFHLTNDPARQLRSLALPGIVAPPDAQCFTPTERDLLLRDGISTFVVDDDGTVRLERVITTYQKSPLGVDDVAWLDIMIPKTLSRLRYDWASYLSLNFPRHKLANDGSPAAEYSDAVVTPRILHGSWAARCKLYERQGWIEDASRTVALSTFIRNVSDRNRCDARQRVRIIGNLMVFAASLQFEV